MTGNKRKLATTAKEPAAKKAAIENKGKTSGKKKPFQKSNQSTVKKELEVNGSEATTKTADGSRRLQKKQLLQERRGLHPFSSKLEQIKRKWEVLRASQTSKQDREKLVQEILDIIGKDMQQIFLKHDGSRIIQSLLKLGTAQQREAVAEQCIPCAVSLSKSKYSAFLVEKILEYCPKHRSLVISQFYGKVSSLIRIKEAASVIEDIFSTYANEAQRLSLLEEFYGPEFALFKEEQGKSLKQILTDKPSKRPLILNHLMETIRATLKKDSATYSIIHRLMLEGLQICETDQERWELLQLIQEHAVHFVHTKDGASVTKEGILRSGAKERKALLKNLKEWVKDICNNEHGHLVLIKIFDVVDDTTMVQKSILSELTKDISSIISNKFGRRVILYLLAGRSKAYFSKETIVEMEKSDAIRGLTSKKDPLVRRKELLNFVSPSLIEFVAKNVHDCLTIPFYSQLLREVIFNATGDQSALHEALRTELRDSLQAFLSSSSLEEEEEGANIFKNQLSLRWLTALVKDEKEMAILVMGTLEGNLTKLALSGAGFLAAALVEQESTRKTALKELRGSLEALKKQEKTEKKKGLEILIKKLSEY